MVSRIREYQLSDSKRGLWTIAILHSLFGFVLLFPQDTFLLNWGRPQLCLFIALGSILLYRFYGWSNFWVNLSWVVAYGALLVFEWLAFGLPESPIKASNGATVSKGFLLEITLHFVPWVYVGLRVTAGIFLLMLIRVALSSTGEKGMI